MASFSLGYILGSVFPTGWLYTSLGRRKTTQLAFLIMSLALVLYGVSYFIPDHLPLLFLIGTVVARIIEGFTTGIILIAVFSLISINYPAHRARGLAARVCGADIGASIGGVLGGSLAIYLGYFGVFMLFAVLSLLAILLTFIFKEARNESREHSSALTTWQLLSHGRPLFNLLCNAVCEFLLMALQPTLAMRLQTDFGCSTSEIGVFFFLFFGGGTISMAMVMLLHEERDKRKLIAGAMFLMGVFSFLVGPSSLLHFPDSLIVMGIGLTLGGACRGVCAALCPTESVIGGIKAYPLEEARVADIVGSLYNLLFGLSTLVFPIAGSALVKSVGFRLSFDIISIGLLLNGMVYFVSGLKEWRKEREERSVLEEESHLIEN